MVACLIQSNTIPAALRLSHAQQLQQHIRLPHQRAVIREPYQLVGLPERPGHIQTRVHRPSARLIESTFSANVLRPVVEGTRMSAELMWAWPWLLFSCLTLTSRPSN